MPRIGRSTAARPRPSVGGRVVAIEGPSAVGKTEAVGVLVADGRGVRIAEAVDRLRPRPDLDFRSDAELERLELRLLREDGRRFVEARRRAGAGATVLLDTGSLGPLTYTGGLVATGAAPPAVLARLLREARALLRDGRWGLPDGIVFLTAPDATLRARAATDPRGHPAGLHGRHTAIGRREAAFYRRELAPILGRRLKFVSGSGRPGAVARRIVSALRRFPPGRPPPRLAAEVLRRCERAAPAPHFRGRRRPLPNR
jgi:hypothetical protein